MKESNNLCKIHNLPFSHFCLVKDCPSNIFCEICASKSHQVHIDQVFAIEKFFSRLPLNSQKWDKSSLLQIQNTLNSKTKLIEEMNKRLAEAENEILFKFDELKQEILFLLDTAYSQYTRQIREIHSNAINEIDRGSKKIFTMIKISELIFSPKLSLLPQNPDDLQDLIKYLTRNQEKLDNFEEHIRLRYQQYETLIDNYKSSIKTFDENHFKSVSDSIYAHIRNSFNLKDNNTEQTDQEEMDIPKKESYTGHEGDICCLTVLNKELVATAGRDSLIKLWNLMSGECVGEFIGHKDAVWSLKSAYDGKYLLSASSDKTIRVWKISERKLKKTFKAHTKAVLCLAFFPNEKLLASGSQDTSIILWDMQEGKPARKLMGHTKSVWSLKDTKKGLLISGSEDCLIKIWDIKSSVCIQSIHGHKDTIYCISTFSDDKKLITCSDDETLRVWEIEDGICIHVVRAHEKGVRCFAINPEETLVASGGYDQCLRIWNIQSMKQVKLRDKNEGVIRGIHFLDDFSVLYTDKNLKLFKLNVAQNQISRDQISIFTFPFEIKTFAPSIIRSTPPMTSFDKSSLTLSPGLKAGKPNFCLNRDYLPLYGQDAHRKASPRQQLPQLEPTSPFSIFSTRPFSSSLDDYYYFSKFTPSLSQLFHKYSFYMLWALLSNPMALQFLNITFHLKEEFLPQSDHSHFINWFQKDFILFHQYWILIALLF